MNIWNFEERTCSLVVAWIFEDINFFCDIFLYIIFVSISLRFNRATLVLASVAKENENVII